jgi:hypothetical protein
MTGVKIPENPGNDREHDQPETDDRQDRMIANGAADTRLPRSLV